MTSDIEDVAVKLHAIIRDMLGSNLGGDNSSHETDFCGYR